MKHEEDWWLGGFLIGFVIGAILGFTYTRLVPLSSHPSPAQLSQTDKEIYLVLIAAAYRYDADLAKAEGRLVRLAYEDVGQTIVDLGIRYVDKKIDIRDIRSLASLASGLNQADLNQVDNQLLAYLPTPTPMLTATTSPKSPIATATLTLLAPHKLTPTSISPPLNTSTPVGGQTESPNPTITPRITATPGPNAPFGLAQSVALCDNSADGILRVYVRDRFGKGIPGLQIEVSWPNGQDKFFTGIKSATSPGYADFQMQSGQIYQVKLRELPSTIATEINQAAAERCPNMPKDLIPSWQVVFQQGVTE